MTLYVSVDQVLRIHSAQLARYGGSAGLRDRGMLEAACLRAAMSFAGEDLYPDVATKAAALLHSLVMNHPFVDGNKRVGASAAIVFLRANGYRLGATSEDVAKLTFAVAAGKLGVEELSIWFRRYIQEEA